MSDSHLLGLERPLCHRKFRGNSFTRTWRTRCHILCDGKALFEQPEERVAAADSEQRSKLLRAMDAIRDRHGERAVRHGGGRGSTNPWGPGEAPGRDG